MSVWLTPELTPVYGGTYFPPTDVYYGRPGFKTLLSVIATQVLYLYRSRVFIEIADLLTDNEGVSMSKTSSRVCHLEKVL
jgi:uncharacterized protein YyaL (SSP411 family)